MGGGGETYFSSISFLPVVILPLTHATIGGSLFGPKISVAPSHSAEEPPAHF